MACPYFIPTERLEGVFTFPDRLPLAAGFRGVCGAPGQMLAKPSDDDLREHCNLGHAQCGRLPQDRPADAVRFAAKKEKHQVTLQYVFEKGCRPAGGGALVYDEREERWMNPVSDERLMRQAECFLQAWMARGKARAAGA
ncbi:MAG TPA: hypothetical protein VGL89_09560 [Candidatus Koribacter sp.]|jgi:hypothetical protein